MARTALVTGGNRGIGFEVCRELARAGLTVVLAARDREAGEAAAAKIRKEGTDVRFEMMDVSRDASVESGARRLSAAGLAVDVLVNNAAIYPGDRLLDARRDAVRETMEINFFGAVRTCRAFVPGMIARRYGRVVNVSSGSGSFAEGLPGPPAYALSKAALNALTVKLAAEVSGDVKVNAVCPGWVRTRMGGRNASRSVEEGAETIVWLATLPARGPNGGFFRDRKPIRW
ncbi:MAG TPA: SDR family oxidoreductase [Thermoanaerobaculia bacterium]|nr:SDR family oxidoreductase [Thermoanaerobaculia bacterium]